jgi:hypothetical protein
MAEAGEFFFLFVRSPLGRTRVVTEIGAPRDHGEGWFPNQVEAGLFAFSP